MTPNTGPRSLDEITAEWLSSVFHADISAITCTPIGTGQVGSNIRVAIAGPEGVTGVPHSVVVKLPSPHDASRAAAAAMNTYRREVGFYQHLTTLTAAPHPRCHHAELDDDGGFVLVLDDLADATVGDQLAACSPTRVGAMITTAAALHAPTWGNTDAVEVYDWVGRSTPDTIAMHAGVAGAVIDGFCDRYKDRLDDATLTTARWLVENYVDLDRSGGCPPCLVHGDFRLDNMLFRATDTSEHAILIDYQTVSIGSGPSDVAYLISTSLTPQERRHHESDLWQHYSESLGQRGVTVNDTDYVAAQRIGTASALMMAIIASQIVARTPRGDEMFALMAERGAAHMADHGLGPHTTN